MNAAAHASLLWFTFRDDASCLLQSVRAARHHAPDSPRIIAMDHAQPLPLDVQAELRGAGCQIETDFCERQGNLNGLPHFIHQLEWFTAVGDINDQQHWVVKIDSDTLLNAPLGSWLGQAGPIHTAVCAVQPAWWFQGPCYALRAAALPGLGRYLADHPQTLRHLAPNYPEDLATGTLVAAAYGSQSILALPGGHHSTLFDGGQIAHYDLANWPDFALYHRFRVLHFGNRIQLPPHAPDGIRRLMSADAMRRYSDWLGTPP